MANTFTVSRTHLIFGITLPLALLLGYLIAEPLDSTSLAVLALLGTVLVTPLLIKWHYPLLVFAWNSAFYLPFLPGTPPLWIVMAGIGAVFVLLDRCINPKRPPIFRGSLTWSVVAIAVVVGVTMLMTGGIGLRALGSSTYGGRKYVYIAAAIIGYFVLISRRVPPSRAMLYAGLFFLPEATAFIGDLAFMGGKKFYAIYYLISPQTVVGQVLAQYDVTNPGLRRITGWVNVANAVCLFMLARYGVKGILDLTRPWRLGLTLFFMAGGLYSGFRSFIGGLLLTFGFAFFLEGLHRTKKLLVVVLLGTLCLAGLAAFSTKLPLSVQRSLSFLPIKIDLAAELAAEGSLQWRFEMWRKVAKDIPTYFFKGKGYVIDPNDLFLSSDAARRGEGMASEWAVVSGDYHNGPLSVLIPFGVWGALALGWFLCALGRRLYLNCVYGDPALLVINRALFACFLARVIIFLFLVGDFSGGLPFFACLAGLAVALNGEIRQEERPSWLAATQPRTAW